MTSRLQMAESSAVYRLGLDIGGANLKLFHSCGVATCLPFPMWLDPEKLSGVLTAWLANFPPCETWGVTMTGELADSFAGRREGVHVIVQQTEEAARQCGVGKVGYYSIPGVLVNALEAKSLWSDVASANWHALALWVANWIDRPSLLFDIGGTTSDIIPILPGRVATESRTDFDRLSRNELVYLGTSRTPVCALVNSLPFRDQQVPVMREVFANTDDCALLLGWIDEQPSDNESCDRKPRTKAHAQGRIARMIGLDGVDLDRREAERMAEFVMNAATEKLNTAANCHEPFCNTQWIIAGHANFLLPRPLGIPVVDLADQHEASISRVGPAYAICQLMQNKNWLGGRGND